ncbi:CubicO group peptidase (beta-lactamase class C family) [Alkalihalobacillus xiaoxiensis]|uniref:CubicO group peptidase (Beta-lactamase class C family) n=1 Tax=Shouchella xiaoxiensis TaxID=766895 RepID=A0ABS2SZ84_9BACI|nr:serine hydrolase [Shouchella xiaoxiensis]MBM7839769.1 CubicO group peptidase (beta-lactamase class C family) [Shouchella xiaoxiensis]
MGTKLTDSFLQKTVQQMANKKNNFGAILSVEQGDGKLSWTGAAGNLQADDPYFIASVTKLYVTTIVLLLRAEGKLQLKDQIRSYLSEDLIAGIHILDGIDYSKELTIQHLISNTSGIPDYFAYKQVSGISVADQLFKGEDQSWPLEKVLTLVKEMKPKFKPGQKGKVNYSDTNYQLLGRIIENITGMSIANVFKRYIFDELGFTKTYVYEDVNDQKPVSLHYKSSTIRLPLYFSSVGAEGGIVSTAQETMQFLRAFAKGHFFPKEQIEELKQWQLIFFPGSFYYGIGLEKLWLPRIYSPFKPINEIIGFWGQTGAFAFYNTERDLYFSGTVNQSSGFGHSAAVRAMIQIIRAAS